MSEIPESLLAVKDPLSRSSFQKTNFSQKITPKESSRFQNPMSSKSFDLFLGTLVYLSLYRIPFIPTNFNHDFA